MAKTSKRFAARAQRDFINKKVEKLQRAGLLGAVDTRKPLSKSVINRLHKYNDLVTGKATSVKAPSIKEAARLRKQLGLKGSGRTIVIPKEKKERYTYRKSTGEIVSKRPGYSEGETISKTLAPRQIQRPDANKRLYYTIPERTRGAGRLKRKTFSSFDEMLYYIHKYDLRFEDIEDRLEIEEVTIGSRKDKQRKAKENAERNAAAARYRRKRKRLLKNKRRAGS